MKKTVCDFCGEELGKGTPEKAVVKDVIMHDGRHVDITITAEECFQFNVDSCIRCRLALIVKAFKLVGGV